MPIYVYYLPEVVVSVDDEVPDPGVARRDVGGDLGPRARLGVGLLKPFQSQGCWHTVII